MSVCVDLDLDSFTSDRPERDSPAGSEPAVEDSRAGPVVRAEANLLRLPLFALHTKGLRALDGITCSGRFRRGGETVQFTFSATRNTATLYPGPLARAAHLAFLSLLTDAGTPAPQPLTWTWRELCRRMGVAYSGRTVGHLRDAITATAGLLIRSEAALYSKADGRPVTTRQDALHLYDRVVFVGSAMPDGSVSDENRLWLADWYRASLDACFAAPLDYGLWRRLDTRSPIASRLYEFLLVNFHAPTPFLQIRYETLARFLPVKAERFRSAAERQLSAAFEFLRTERVLGGVEWAVGRNTLARLVLHRGELLSARGSRTREIAAAEGFAEAEGVEVKELRNSKPAERQLVEEFYRRWTGDASRRPGPRELADARRILEGHGLAKARALVAVAVKRLRVAWPEAKTFGAVVTYLPEAIAEYEKGLHREDREREERDRQQAERQNEVEKAAERASLKLAWDALKPAEREGIRRAVLARQPRSIEKFPELLERLCLEEFGRWPSLADKEVEPLRE